MLRQAPATWQALASYAAEHDLLALSADALERAALARPTQRGKLLAAAAINVAYQDRARSRALLDEAKEAGENSLTVLVAETLLGHPEGDAGPFNLDQRLLAGGTAIRRDHLIQTLLSENRARSGDPDGACHHARLALEAEPENSNAMLVLALAHMRRSASNRRQPSDLPEAIRLLEAAITQRRSWSGPTIPYLTHLVRALGLNGQYATALAVCLKPPDGSASADEADDPKIRRHALYAAWAAGRRELLPDLSTRLGDTVEDRVAKLRVGTLNLKESEQEKLWLFEIDRASKENDYEAVLKASIALALLGVDERPRVARLSEASIVPATYLELIAALLEARVNLDAALPSLRSLSRRESIAVEFLIGKLTEAGRHAEAAENCAAIYAHTNEPFLLIARAQCLIRIESSEAEAAARTAVSITTGFPEERADLFRFLGTMVGNREEWDAAEADFAEALTTRPQPATTDVWNLVLSQVNQGRLRRAANVLAKYQPTVRSPLDAQLWLQANNSIEWDEAKASEALALARRVKDPKISTALLGQIVMRTHGVESMDSGTTATPTAEVEADEDNLEARRRLAQPAVAAALHREAFSALQELIDEFGESTGVNVLQGDPHLVAEQMLEVSRQREAATEGLREVLRAAQEHDAPRGFMASIVGKSHAAILIQRALGPLVSAAADDSEHELDVASATGAIGKPVVVDVSTMLSLTALKSSTPLEGQFPALYIPTGTLYDIYAAGFEIRSLAGSPGTFGWDSKKKSGVFWELPEEEYIRQLRRIQAVEDLAENFSSRTLRNGLTLFQELAAKERNLAWLESIQLAHDEDVPLWSDDIGLRRLAREFGVRCFGTPALIDSLRDKDLADDASESSIASALDRTMALNRQLAHDFVADLPIHLEDLTWLAKQDDWEPRSAAVVLSRPSWWAWQTNAIKDLVILYRQVAQNNRESLPEWQRYALLGAAKAFRSSDHASRVLADIALIGFGDKLEVEIVVGGLKQARAIARELGLADPLLQIPSAISRLSRAAQIPKLEELLEEIMASFDEGEEPQESQS